MNPCLDYVKNIVFSAPDESLTAGGVTYTSYEDVAEALLGGKLAPDALKEALGIKVNELLEVCVCVCCVCVYVCGYDCPLLRCHTVSVFVRAYPG